VVIQDASPETNSDPAHPAWSLPADAPPTAAEGSLIGRFVAIITPFFALFAGWLAGVVAGKLPGVNLDKGQIVAFMVAVTTAALTTGWKYLQGWQQHEQNVADGKAPPVKPKPVSPS
jgi:hypothetical protein